MKMHPQKNEIVVSSFQETIKEKIVLKVKPVERFKKKTTRGNERVKEQKLYKLKETKDI